MNVTLFVDASFCHKTGAAGWGAWAIADQWERSSVFGGPVHGAVTVNDAEIGGVAAALAHLVENGSLDGVPFVVLQVDNMRVLQLLVKFAGARLASAKDCDVDIPERLLPSAMEAASLDRIRAVLAGTPVWLRHVKGHKQGDGRHWVNSQCDAEARRHMQAQRETARG